MGKVELHAAGLEPIARLCQRLFSISARLNSLLGAQQGARKGPNLGSNGAAVPVDLVRMPFEASKLEGHLDFRAFSGDVWLFGVLAA